MILDTSAVVAILKMEPDLPVLAAAIQAASVRRMSAASWLEAAIVIERLRDPEVSRAFDEFIEESGVEIVPVSLEQARLARAAYRDYGKGSGHPARLNFGDCFAYALATWMREPLLYKGDDFSYTDVRSALAKS